MVKIYVIVKGQKVRKVMRTQCEWWRQCSVETTRIERRVGLAPEGL